MKDNKKFNVLLLIAFIFVLVVVLMIISRKSGIFGKGYRSIKEERDYIYSEEIDKGTFSPNLIHVPINVYKGEVKPQAFSKACYLFVTHYIPEFYKKCVIDGQTEKYYSQNKDELRKIMGIKSYEDFEAIVQNLETQSGNLKYESSNFVMDEVFVTNGGIEANLHVKYENNPELVFVMRVENKERDNVSSISFSID